GIAANLVPVIVNGGYMPIWTTSLLAAGFTPADVHSQFHTLLPVGFNATFLLHAGPLGDLIPIPLPLVQNVASIGDIFLAGGLSFFAFASVVRQPGTVPAEPAVTVDRTWTTDQLGVFSGSQRPITGARLTGLAGSARLP